MCVVAFIQFPAKFINCNTEFLVFDTKFLVFDTKLLVFNTKFIMFTHIFWRSATCSSAWSEAIIIRHYQNPTVINRNLSFFGQPPTQHAEPRTAVAPIIASIIHTYLQSFERSINRRHVYTEHAASNTYAFKPVSEVFSLGIVVFDATWREKRWKLRED